MSGISKQEDITIYELDALKEIRKKLSEGEERAERNDILRGTIFGLFLGVLGVIFTLSLCPVAQALQLGEYSQAFTTNLICVASLISIVCLFAYLYRQLTRCESKLQLSKKSQDVLD